MDTDDAASGLKVASQQAQRSAEVLFQSQNIAGIKEVRTTAERT